MNHLVAPYDEWRTARLALLQEEKELTRRSDELARQRQALPWVRVGKAYRFETEAGTASLPELFRGRSQLLVYHFMFGPDWKAGCPSCSMIADGFDGFAAHLANHDVTLMAVSRAPLPKLLAYRDRMGWSFPWASAGSSDFNADFGVEITEEQQKAGGVEYNYSPQAAFEWQPPPEGDGTSIVEQFAATCGTDVPSFRRDRPGISTFAMQGGAVHHCYSAYSRGVDGLWGAYAWLDRAPLGRNESGGPWWKRRDEYAAA